MAALLILLFAIPSGLTHAATLAPEIPVTREVAGYARWGDEFENLGQLVSTADAVAEVTFIRPVMTRAINPAEELDPSAPFFTLWLARVQESIAKRPLDDEILVLQTGGERLGAKLQLTDELLYTAESDFVLFLDEARDEMGNPILADGKAVYFAVGGPQGEFVVTDGAVFSVDHFLPAAGWIKVKANGQPVSEFAASVREAVG